MASYKCPCCGHAYNGKRCKNCFYENFTEEITHGGHTHAGEPLVISKPEPKRRPQPTIQRSSDCSPYAGKKKKKSSPLKWILLAITVLSMLSEVYESMKEEHVWEERSYPDASVSEKFGETDTQEVLKMPETGLVLYDNGDILVMADWEQGRTFENPVTVWIQNGSDTDLIVTTQELYVNGHSMKNASLSCSAASGEVSRGELRLDMAELKACGVDYVRQIQLDLWLLDWDLCPVDTTGELVSLDYALPG